MINAGKCVNALFWMAGVILLVLFTCEYLIYYVVIGRCGWPKLNETLAEKSTKLGEATPNALKGMFIADTHLLGPYRGHWFDKLKREWQMFRAFQTAIDLYEPEVVFILGDLFDEGLWCNHKQFDEYLKRLHLLFEVPPKTKLYVVPGNHDLGFHYRLRYDLFEKFNKAFNASAVQFLYLKGNYFVLINSMAMHGDMCFLCSEAEFELKRIAKKLNCLKNGKLCGEVKRRGYSRPIVLQHFPMFRNSDAECNERDAAPAEIKNAKFREKWDCLSQKASEMIYDLLNPRLIMTGHSHHGCKVLHRKDIVEFTLSSFNWRNKNNPTFMLGVFSSNDYALMKCDLPRETTTIFIYFLILCLSFAYLMYRQTTERHIKHD